MSKSQAMNEMIATVRKMVVDGMFATDMDVASEYAQRCGECLLIAELTADKELVATVRKVFYPLVVKTHQYRFGHPFDPTIWIGGV